jgi:hypothetical protein
MTKARPQFAGEEDDFQISRVAANVLNRESLPLYGPLTYGLDKSLTPHCKGISILRSITQSSGFGNHWRSLVNKQIKFSLHENARKFLSSYITNNLPRGTASYEARYYQQQANELTIMQRKISAFIAVHLYVNKFIIRTLKYNKF